MAYWLMKSEPDCYSIDDLKAAGGPAMWEGCRNYTVRNFFRDTMAPGDLAFFYHSSVTPAGIVGTMEIVGDAYPDPTQFDPSSDYYDPKSPKESPRWLLRDVVFREKLDRMITLDELRKTPGLEGMAVLQRGQRLSVMPVSAEEWAIVIGLRGQYCGDWKGGKSAAATTNTAKGQTQYAACDGSAKSQDIAKAYEIQSDGVNPVLYRLYLGTAQ